MGRQGRRLRSSCQLSGVGVQDTWFGTAGAGMLLVNRDGVLPISRVCGGVRFACSIDFIDRIDSRDFESVVIGGERH